MASEVQFRPSPIDGEPGARLVQAMRDEMGQLYDGLEIDAVGMPKAGPAELGPPDGSFLVGWIDGEAVCCGGVKALADGACELKRMFVVPSARYGGVARQLLAALEDEARRLGYTVARLDTGPRQPHAQRLFERAGYLEIENFNGNPVASYFAEKRLT